MTQYQAIRFLCDNPCEFGHMVGFTKLTDLHNGWIKDMMLGKEDNTLQAHRASYKTTCISIALALICILKPNSRTLFVRKTDTDVKEIIKQVQKILLDEHTRYFVQCIYNADLKLTVSSATEVSTNLTNDPRGTAQLVGMGLGSSLTGKHFDRIFTDDIVNINDRISKAERDRTKLVYQELQNIKNRGGRIYNIGTPWHKDDCFTLMPPAEKYDCYSTGLMSKEEIEKVKEQMTRSLFCANYELKHIASDDIIFSDPQKGADPALVEQGIAHVDAAFYGEDYTAFGVIKKHEGKYYIFGKCWRKHVEQCYAEIVAYYQQFMCGKMYLELNADKGLVARDLKKLGVRTVTYTETTNKHIKIVMNLKPIWKDVIFVEGTDEEYINQICDYTENSEHDDCPDNASSLARELAKKSSTNNYVPIWN